MNRHRSYTREHYPRSLTIEQLRLFSRRQSSSVLRIYVYTRPLFCLVLFLADRHDFGYATDVHRDIPGRTAVVEWQAYVSRDSVRMVSALLTSLLGLYLSKPFSSCTNKAPVPASALTSDQSVSSQCCPLRKVVSRVVHLIRRSEKPTRSEGFKRRAVESN